MLNVLMTNPIAVDKLNSLEKLVSKFIELEQHVMLFNKSKRYQEASKVYNEAHNLVVKMKGLINDLSLIAGDKLLSQDFDGSSYFPKGILKSNALTNNLNIALKNYNLPDRDGFIIQKKIHSRKLNKMLIVQKRSLATKGALYPVYKDCISINGDEALVLKNVHDAQDLADICLVKEVFDGTIIKGGNVKNPEIEMKIDGFPSPNAPEIPDVLDYSKI